MGRGKNFNAKRQDHENKKPKQATNTTKASEQSNEETR